MKAYNVIFELCEYQPEVRIKFSDVMNFIKYFNKKILELSVNQVFDNFKVIFLGKHLDTHWHTCDRHLDTLLTHLDTS